MSTQIETVRVASTDPASQGPFVVINKRDFDPQQHTVYDPEAEAKAAEAERLRLQAEAEAAEKAEAERLAALRQPEAAPAADAPAAAPARKRAGSTTPTTEA